MDAGEAVRFVISATLSDGTPATRLRLHYAWHSTNYGANYTSLQERAYGANGGMKGDTNYGDVTTDAQGNAIVALPVERDGLEMYVYDPDTNELVIRRAQSYSLINTRSPSRRHSPTWRPRASP